MRNGRALREVSVELVDCRAATNASTTTEVSAIVLKSAYASGSERE